MPSGENQIIEVDVEKALGDFTLTVRASWPLQGLTAVFGRSGAGKTTFINLIAGVLAPTRGRIVVGGQVFDDGRFSLPVHRRQIGYVHQDARLFPHLTVERNLLYGYRRTTQSRGIAPQELVELLGLQHLLRRRPHHLSGGEKQRVALGRALLSQPRLLLMDEPLASLDVPRRLELMSYLEGLRDHYHIPTLYISHNVDEILRLADGGLLIDHGRLIRHGPIQELISDPALGEYLGHFDPSAVVLCTVLGHDANLGVSDLAFAGGTLRVPTLAQAVGTQLRMRIRARDVILSRDKPGAISATNVLSGVVRAFTPRQFPLVDVQVEVGQTMLRALLTTESIGRLQLAPGVPVWVMLKVASFESRAAT